MIFFAIRQVPVGTTFFRDRLLFDLHGSIRFHQFDPGQSVVIVAAGEVFPVMGAAALFPSQSARQLHLRIEQHILCFVGQT